MKEIELTPKAEEDLEAIWDYSFRQFGIVQADAYMPVEQHMIYFVSSHSVVTIIRILSQSQDTARHEPWR